MTEASQRMPTGVLQVVYLMLESGEAEQAVILWKWGAAQPRLLLSFFEITTHARSTGGKLSLFIISFVSAARRAPTRS